MSLPVSTTEKKKSEANTLVIRPTLENRFQVATVKEIIKEVLKEKLKDAKYGTENTKAIADTIKNRLKALGLPRYKYAVQVFIAEAKQQGIRIGTRSVWDTASDGVASESFQNDHIFAVAIAYGAYTY